MANGMEIRNDDAALKLSIVVPVYNSAKIISATLASLQCSAVDIGMEHEIILVNDGSSDESWTVLTQLALTQPKVLALNLAQRVGQHYATLCGMAEAQGELVVTIDDDLQCNPAHIARLLAQSGRGSDLVFGRYAVKQHNLVRRLGSRIMRTFICYVGGAPAGLYISSFRLMRSDVVGRMLAAASNRPNINCLALLSARSPANADVDHYPRQQGASGYTMGRLVALVLSMLFEYSLLPMKAAAVVALAAMVLTGAVFATTGSSPHGEGAIAREIAVCAAGVSIAILLSTVVTHLVRLAGRRPFSSSKHIICRVRCEQ